MAERQFVRQILNPPFVVERADGRIAIGPVEQDGTDDRDAGAQRYRIGGEPAGRMHRSRELCLGAHDADVQRIARNVLRGTRHHRSPCKTTLMFVVCKQDRQDRVGHSGPEPQQHCHHDDDAFDVSAHADLPVVPIMARPSAARSSLRIETVVAIELDRWGSNR